MSLSDTDVSLSPSPLPFSLQSTKTYSWVRIKKIAFVYLCFNNLLNTSALLS